MSLCTLRLSRVFSDQATPWDDQAGWGALDAYRAVQHRNLIRDDQLMEDQP